MQIVSFQRRHVEALHLVLDALDLHLSNSNLQIAGSASMFYIIRHVNMNRDTKRRVIFALLNGTFQLELAARFGTRSFS